MRLSGLDRTSITFLKVSHTVLHAGRPVQGEGEAVERNEGDGIVMDIPTPSLRSTATSLYDHLWHSFTLQTSSDPRKSEA